MVNRLFVTMPQRALVDSNLTALAVRVLGLIIDRCPDNLNECSANQTELAGQVGVSRQAIIKAIGSLAEYNYLEIQHTEDGLTSVNKYRVLDLSHKDDNMSPQKPPSMYTLAKAVAVACKMDFEANRGYLLKEAKAIVLLPQFSMVVFADLYAPLSGIWYRADWRGKRGSPPTPKQIKETWLQLIEHLSNSPESNLDEGWTYA